VFRDVFADTNIPGVALPNVQADGVRPHHSANADVSVAQQHALEEILAGQVSYHHMAARNLKTIERLVFRGCGDARGRRKGITNGDQSGSLEKFSAGWFHGMSFVIWKS
jgi:hypothetical protein